MLIFNRKILCKCKTVNEKISILNKLKEADIEYQCKIKGTNSRTVETMQDIFWFNIYVAKENYEKAYNLMKSDKT